MSPGSSSPMNICAPSGWSDKQMISTADVQVYVMLEVFRLIYSCYDLWQYAIGMDHSYDNASITTSSSSGYHCSALSDLTCGVLVMTRKPSRRSRRCAPWVSYHSMLRRR